MSHRSMSQRSWWFSACLTAAILIAATAIIPNAHAKDPKRTITLSATGTINVKTSTFQWFSAKFRLFWRLSSRSSNNTWR